jgi:hypothetical protein
MAVNKNSNEDFIERKVYSFGNFKKSFSVLILSLLKNTFIDKSLHTFSLRINCVKMFYRFKRFE